jgi:ATP/maltotriose-dependent transcriptional regulator MalT
MLEELGLTVRVARASQESWRVEMLAGDAEAAERELRRGYDALTEIGERYLLSTIAGLLGQTLYALGRFAEVEALGTQARELATPDDVDTQALWRCVRSKVLARQGGVGEGEQLVREALAILEPTDAVLFRFGAHLDHAEVLRLAGRPDEARAAIGEALKQAQLKRSAVLVASAEAMLAAPAEGSLVN